MGLLERITGLKAILNDNRTEEITFDDLAELFAEGNKDVYIVNADGELLGNSLLAEDPIFAELLKNGKFSSKENKKIQKLHNAIYNMSKENKLEYLPKAVDKYVALVPIYAHHQKLGQLLFAGDDKFGEEDIIFGEMAAAVTAIEMIHAASLDKEIDAKKIAVVEKAINTLSYSELEAVKNIINELEGEEGILVASRIADRAGITRSVIVNALRKLESAGVISSHSLGMKGTRIKILNDKLKNQLKEKK